MLPARPAAEIVKRDENARFSPRQPVEDEIGVFLAGRGVAHRVEQMLPQSFPCYRLEESSRQYFRSEEHTSELQSLMRISYAVFCLKKKTNEIIKDQIIRCRVD